jgi:hypothetical protein
MNANYTAVYMQCSIYSGQEKARCPWSSGLKSKPWGLEETGAWYDRPEEK